MNNYIDLNADLGESFGTYQYGADEMLLPLVTSANIACGWHGGDPCVMHRAVVLACENKVAIGAHPSYPDRMGFGRRYMSLSPQEVANSILYQIGALDGICRAEGGAVVYVKPHGALYNAAAKDVSLATAIVDAIRSYSPELVLLCPCGSAMAKVAEAAGLRVAREFFADRGYQDDGTLVPRSQAGAVISDPALICQRVLRAIQEGTVEATCGQVISVRLDSICLHGDNPSAVMLARSIRDALVGAGVELKAFTGGH